MTDTRLLTSRGVLIDTNLLILWVVGAMNPSQISTYKRTNQYSSEDYSLLTSYIDRFKVILTTPNILTEASNLLEGYTYKGQQALSLLERVAQKTQEVFHSSLSIMDIHSKSYLKFGLSDAIIHHLAADNYTVLTDDLKFCSYLQSQGLLAINFNNLRTDFLLH
ncbi:hypothetical protein LC612_43920 [Nostoc sp. CHAB 5834]|nr:hypothetical protein [Nostoc sp. CHAB 5834]